MSTQRTTWSLIRLLNVLTTIPRPCSSILCHKVLVKNKITVDKLFKRRQTPFVLKSKRNKLKLRRQKPPQPPWRDTTIRHKDKHPTSKQVYIRDGNMWRTGFTCVKLKLYHLWKNFRLFKGEMVSNHCRRCRRRRTSRHKTRQFSNRSCSRKCSKLDHSLVKERNLKMKMRRCKDSAKFLKMSRNATDGLSERCGRLSSLGIPIQF